MRFKAFFFNIIPRIQSFISNYLLHIYIGTHKHTNIPNILMLCLQLNYSLMATIPVLIKIQPSRKKEMLFHM